jgi:hypothetical protein
MISIYWGYLPAVLETGVLTLLLAYLAEGLFDIEFDGRRNPPREGIATAAGVCGAIAYFFLLAYLDPGLRSWDGWTFSMGEFARICFGLPVALLAGFLGIGFALTGGVKLLGRVGGALRRVGQGLRNIGSAMRSKRAAKVAMEQERALAAAAQQTTALEQARKSFADVRNLCQALRQRLVEGPAFDQLGAISTELERVRAAVEEDSNKQSALGTLLSDYLVPTEQALRLYDRLLKRNVGSAQDSLREMSEKTLPLMRQKIITLYDQIHVADIAQLSTVAASFEVARPLEVKLEAEAKL